MCSVAVGHLYVKNHRSTPCIEVEAEELSNNDCGPCKDKWLTMPTVLLLARKPDRGSWPYVHIQWNRCITQLDSPWWQRLSPKWKFIQQ